MDCTGVNNLVSRIFVTSDDEYMGKHPIGSRSKGSLCKEKLTFSCKQQQFDHELLRTTNMEGFNTISAAAFQKIFNVLILEKYCKILRGKTMQKVL